jgi:hypothetical protein
MIGFLRALGMMLAAMLCGLIIGALCLLVFFLAQGA